MNKIDDEFLRADRKSKRVLLILLSISLACLLYAVSSYAAIKSSKEDAPTIVLKRGSTTVQSGFASLDACEARKAAVKATDAPLKETGSAVYDCIHTMRSRVAFGPNPPPPTCTAAKPADEERPQECPAGTTGAWTQQLTYTSAPYPTCWAPGGWLPASAPAEACVAPNRLPTISGTPVATGVVGVPYSFTPTAADPDGDALTFIVDNRPPWATFDATTGKLFGTPGPTHVGVRSELRIRVQDGRGGEAVLAFGKLTILPAPSTSATLSWTPPAKNTDDTALTNLAGYRIVYGTEPSALTRMVDIPNPVTTSYIVDQLTPATWYFAVRAYNAAGAESVNSNIASKTLP